MKKLLNWNGEKDYAITNVLIVDPSEGKTFPGHLIIKDGSLEATGEGDAPKSGLPVFDGEGLHLSPGFIDIHVHLREPGFEHKEDIRSGTLAAAAGGFTSVACMPNTDPAIDDKSVVDFILRKARTTGFAKVYPVAAATVGRKGEKLSEFGRLVQAGAVAFSDDGAPIATAQMMRRVLEYAGHFDVPVIEHCEDLSTSAGGVMNEGFYSTKLGLPGIPSFSEEICLARDLLVLRNVRARLHVAHVSSAGSVEMIREAKKRGLRVTCETAPHYFSLDDGELEGYDPNLRINPPLRSADDRDAIIRGLKDGTIDCIATDHAPHALEEKEVEFDRAPAGAIGLETALAVACTFLVKPGHLSLAEVIRLLTVKPAEVIGIPGGVLEKGAPADLTLFDPEEEWVVDAGGFHSKSKNSPFIGRKLSGRVKHTIIEGRVISFTG
jgi:dihydroorotase